MQELKIIKKSNLQIFDSFELSDPYSNHDVTIESENRSNIKDGMVIE